MRKIAFEKGLKMIYAIHKEKKEKWAVAKAVNFYQNKGTAEGVKSLDRLTALLIEAAV